MARDCLKLSSVFSKITRYSRTKKPIFSTGNWGCGEFYGNKVLKFCLQWLVASYYNVELRYIIPNENDLHDQINTFIGDFKKTRFQTIGMFYDYLIHKKHILKDAVSASLGNTPSPRTVPQTLNVPKLQINRVSDDIINDLKKLKNFDSSDPKAFYNMLASLKTLNKTAG
jgi:hypothetical protein